MSASRKGRPQLGGVLGYRRVPAHVVVDPEGAETVRRVFELIVAGETVLAVSQALDMHERQVRRVLSRPGYKHPGELRIIEPALWRRAQRALARRNKPL